MKKLLSMLLAAASIITLAGCGTSKNKAVYLEDYTWQLTTIQSNEDGAVIAYSPYAISNGYELYPTAIIYDLVCTAENGILKLNDTANNQVYEGTYTKSDTTELSIIYDITLLEENGNAVVSLTKYSDGLETPTLILSTENYALNFQEKSSHIS